MTRIFAFILSFFISSTLVFAQHTISYYTPTTRTVSTNTEETSTNACMNKHKILRKLDRKIRKAERRNESIETSIATLLNKYDKYRNKEIKKVNRVLRSQKKTNKLYNKISKNNPKLSKEEMVQKLKFSTNETKTVETKENIKNEILSAGSYVNFLKDVREKIDNCDKSRSPSSFDAQNETLYLILLIIFLGTPILALIAALVVVILGMFPLALGLSIYAVSMLALFFIISNIGPSSLEANL